MKLFQKQQHNLISGTYVVNKKTKELITNIIPNQIAVIKHEDIDEIAANGLITKKVQAVINFSSSMTGKYHSGGVSNLIEAKIPVFDVITNRYMFERLISNTEGTIDTQKSYVTLMSKNGTLEFRIELWTKQKLDKAYDSAMQNMEKQLNQFIDNTLDYAQKEKEFVLKPLNIPELKTKIKGRHVVVVVRGNNYREDLLAIRSYIEDYRPILIGVDGGADALLEYGLKPDLIIGDMDSVSDKALNSGAEIVVHAYEDGRAPGLKRIENLGLPSKAIPSVGTSEDVAMLMAYQSEAELIIALGAHSHMIDFLEKGRMGMASTVLVRMKIGTKLIDAKGVNKLYQPRTKWKSLTLIGIAATTPIIAISLINQDMVNLLQIMWINIKMLFV